MRSFSFNLQPKHIFPYSVLPEAAVADGDRKTQFPYFLEQIEPSWRHISALIHARVEGPRVDVVTLHD